jgi:hypothetical protein
MRYNPDDLDSRLALTKAIISKLNHCKFTTEQNFDSPVELVYTLPVRDTKIFINVFTSISNGLVRVKDKDAIRIAGNYSNGEISRGLVSETRVNRVGQIDDIVERMYLRMRDCYSSCNKVKRCHRCNAPTFLSKSNNLVCAEICWKTK